MLRGQFRPEFVGAVVIAYQQDISLLSRLVQRLLFLKLGAVVIVNNGDGSLAVDDLLPHRASSRDALSGAVHVLSPGLNLGVAGGLNLGVRQLEQLGCSLAWSFDQDSLPDPGALTMLLDEWSRNPEVAALAPNAFVQGRAAPLPFLLSNPAGAISATILTEPGDVVAAITSGFLCRVDAWNAVGGAFEPLFIDHVDTDLCFRLRSAGWRIRAVPSARIGHHLGSPGPRLAFVLGPHTTLRSPMRTYYMLRNGWLLGRTEYAPPGWRKYQRWQAMKIFVVALLHGPARMHQLAAMLRAFRDALIRPELKR